MRDFGQLAGKSGQLAHVPPQPVAPPENSPPGSSGRRRFSARQASRGPRPRDGPRRESAAGSRIGNGRRTPQLLPSRFGLGTSARDKARKGRRLHRAGRGRSRGRRRFRPPEAGLATVAGRSGRRGGCGPGTAAVPRAESRWQPVRPRPPTQGPGLAGDKARLAADRLGQKRLPVGAGRLHAICQGRILPEPDHRKRNGKTNVASYNTSEFRKG